MMASLLCNGKRQPIIASAGYDNAVRQIVGRWMCER
jgi:hypothetical protein